MTTFKISRKNQWTKPQDLRGMVTSSSTNPFSWRDFQGVFVWAQNVEAPSPLREVDF